MTDLRQVFISMFVFAFVFYSFEPLLSYYSTTNFDATPTLLAFVFMYIAIFEVGFQTVLGD